MNRKVVGLLCGLLIVGLLAAGCSKNDGDTTGTTEVETTETENVTLSIWRGVGTDGEEELHSMQIDDFNRQSEHIKVKAEIFPYGEFTNTVKAAASTNSLPDMMFMDGTVVANMAFLDAIVPVDEYIDENIKANFTDSAFVKYNGSVYGLNEQEGALALWANRSHLEKAKVRIPTYEEPWSKDEFLNVLADLKALDGVEYPLDLKVNWGPGYVVYAWQPIIRSFGGNWWDEETHKVTGALDSEKTVKAFEYIKDLVDKGYVNNMQTEDAYLIKKQASLVLTGHWDYASFKPELGDDLMLVPIPDFGEGSYTAVGGISFTVSSEAKKRGVVEQAMEFINFALGDKYQKKVNDASGALPANLSILNTLDTFKEGGELYLYTQQLEGGRFVVRPESASFPTFQEQVGKAAFDILVGSDPQERLADAAKEIQQVMDDNESRNK